MKKKRVNNPPEMWIRRDRAFPQIISTEQFVETQQIIEARHRHMNDAEMLVRLKGLWEKQGALSGVLIDEDDDMPSSGVYRRRFQSLIRAYTLIGYTPQRDYAFLEVNQLVREKSRDLCDSIVARLHENGASVETNALNGLLLVNHEFSASLVLARCRETLTGSHRWFIRLEASLLPDITIAARLAPGNRDVLDFYLLPNLDRLSEKLSLASENPYNLDVYRFENLNFFMSLGRRVVIREAA